MKTFEELQKEMYGIAEKLGVPLSNYRRDLIIPTEKPWSNVGVWYEMGEEEYLVYFTEEKSNEVGVIGRIKDENELLYRCTLTLISKMAQSWAEVRRRPGVDIRPVWFARELELFGLINHEWQQKRAEYLNKVLERAGLNSSPTEPVIDADYAKRNMLYLETNKNKEGVEVDEYGIQYEVLRSGDGLTPTRTDTLTLHYIGSDIDGEEFDNSYKRGAPIKRTLSQLAPALIQGVGRMNVGAKYRFVLSADMAYVSTKTHSRKIKPGSTLVYVIELFDIE